MEPVVEATPWHATTGPSAEARKPNETSAPTGDGEGEFRAGAVGVGGRPTPIPLLRSMAGSGASNLAIARLAVQRKPPAPPGVAKQPNVTPELQQILKSHRATTVVDAIKDIVWVNQNQGSQGGDDLLKLWGSWGDGLQEAVVAHLDIWNSSARKYPLVIEKLPPVSKARAAFKAQTIAKATANLDANEKLIRADMAKYGINEQTDPNDPRLAGANNALVLPEVKQSLEEVKRLAQVVKTQQDLQAGLRKEVVTWDRAPFSPDHEPDAKSQLPHLPEMGPSGPTRWKAMKQKWDKSQSLMGLVLNSNPAVFLAHTDPAAMERLTKGNPKEEPAKMLGDLRTKYLKVLKNVDRARSGLSDVDYRELRPIHDGLRAGPFKHKFSQWIIDDAVSDFEDTQYWTKLGLEAAAFTALIVAEIATFGGATFFIAAGIGLGVAAYQAAEASNKAEAMKAMGGSVARADLNLVYRGQITAAEAEAEQAMENLVMTAGGIAFGAATRVGEAERVAATKARLDAMRKRFAQEIAEDAKLQKQIDSLDELLKSPSNAQRAEQELTVAQGMLPRSSASGPKTVPMPGAVPGEFKWGMPREQRLPQVRSLGNARLTAEGVPEAGAIEMLGGPHQFGVFNHTQWELGASKLMIDAESLTPAQYAIMLDTINHEARHAKQYWAIARLKAGETGGAAFLKANGYPERIIQKALSNKMMPNDAEAKFAQEMLETFFGRGSKHRSEVLTKLAASEKAATAALADADAALAQLKAAQAGAVPADIAKADTTYQGARGKLHTANRESGDWFLKYQALPEEIDARVAAKVQSNQGIQSMAKTGRADVRNAKGSVDLAEKRLGLAHEEIARYRALGASDDAIVHADEARALAEDDLRIAREELTKAMGR